MSKSPKAAARAKKTPAPRETTERFTWHGIEMSATHTPNYISTDWSHIELRVVKPKGVPVPITDTGYLSHFLDANELRANGGAVAFFLAWLDHEANSKAYAKALAKWRQLDLFAKR